MICTSTPPTFLDTKHGRVQFPAYVPVTTFGGKYPLDELVRPYLKRLAPAVMVSLHYAKQMKERPNLPLMIDSGGFASLFKDAIVQRSRGLGVLLRGEGDEQERLHPRDVLEFQEAHADIAFTLDFPIPPQMGKREAKRRLELTIANASWAVENKRRKDLRLYACVQGWDFESYRDCAKAFASAPFDGIAIGGLVPRMRDRESLFAIVDAVRATSPHLPLHVFGVGKPEVVEQLYGRGVQSVDSSSYVKAAADGKLWTNPDSKLLEASPMERLHLALCNLATATQATLPLSTSRAMFQSLGVSSRGAV